MSCTYYVLSVRSNLFAIKDLRQFYSKWCRCRLQETVMKKSIKYLYKIALKNIRNFYPRPLYLSYLSIKINNDRTILTNRIQKLTFKSLCLLRDCKTFSKYLCFTKTSKKNGTPQIIRCFIGMHHPN